MHFKEEIHIIKDNESTESIHKETEMKSVDTAEYWQDHEELPDGWQMENSRNIRPKLYDQIEFKVGSTLKSGKVTKNGKKTGKDAFRCWIKEGDNEYSYDFRTEVKHWRKTDRNLKKPKLQQLKKKKQ